MRIDGNGRPVSLSTRGKGRKGGGDEPRFSPESASAAGRAAGKAPVRASAGIDAILALQAVEDPLFAKKKAVRRGKSMLDVLEDMKTDLLAGQMNEGRLHRLMAVLGQARESSEPGLDALIEDIELRARVELAKRGVYAPA